MDLDHEVDCSPNLISGESQKETTDLDSSVMPTLPLVLKPFIIEQSGMLSQVKTKS